MKSVICSKDPSNELVFENQIHLIPASEFCSRFGYSMKTIYEWKYRPRRNKIPQGLVTKFRGKLFIRTDILKGLFPSDFPPTAEERKK